MSKDCGRPLETRPPAALVGILLLLTMPGCDLGTSDLISTDNLDRAWAMADSEADARPEVSPPPVALASSDRRSGRSAPAAEKEPVPALFEARADSEASRIESADRPSSSILEPGTAVEADGSVVDAREADGLPPEV